VIACLSLLLIKFAQAR